MERSLATIQRINAIDPIEGADRIETATVLGWKVVVKKGEFAPGDKCVYFEVDSLLPDRPVYEFMRPYGYRIKTVLLRGQLSQGLALPLGALGLPDDLDVGADVTSRLDVQLYRHPSEDDPDSEIIGPLPGFIPRTKEPRVQSFPDVLDELRGHPCYITTKLNGRSCTVYNDGDKLLVCGRRGQMRKHSESPYWKAIAAYQLDRKMEAERSHYAVQGEVVGPGIQGNQLKLDHHDFFCFDVYDVRMGRYLAFPDFLAFCAQHDLKTVPIDQQNLTFSSTLPQLLMLAQGEYASGHPREGIVIRPTREQYSKVLKGRLSFKVLNNQHLLKEK